MKNLATIIIIFFAFVLQAQEQKSEQKSQIVEVSCGECNFGMKGKSCDLAVRIDGKTYFVDGTKIDDHGNAHAKNGFCEVIRKAEVTGKIVNNRFQATTFILLPEEK
ncbi:hypothetical protein MCETHM1_00441 [Flavobacteriaceae bacterium]